MTDDRTLERAARSWLEEGPTQAPDRAVDAALARIQTVRQERDLIPWRLPTMTSASRAMAGIATLAVVLVIGLIAIVPRLGPGFGGQPTPSPTPTPLISAPAPSATPNLGACRLLSSAEAADIGGDPGLGALPTQTGGGDVTTCIYSDGGGNVVFRLQQTRVGGAAAFDTARAGAGIEAVADLGEAAAYEPATFTLYVLKGDAMLAVDARGFLDDPATRRSKAIALAQVAVPRL